MNILFYKPCPAKINLIRSMMSIYRMVVCCLLFTLSALASEGFSAEDVAPARDISIVSKDVVDSSTPDWMNLWEEARALSRIEDYVSAVKLYQKLYQVKPGIEEASWEYCKVLVKTGEYTTVTSVLDGLLEQAPNRSDYLLMAAEVSLRNREYGAAARRFGRVLEKEVVGENADLALKGFVDSLRAQGKKQIAFPLLEQLVLRKPEDLKIIYDLARDAHLLGENLKARHLYELLLEEPDVSDRIIFQAAEVYELVKDYTHVIDIWLTYLRRHPDYLPFRKKVVDLFVETENFADAAVHLEYLVEHQDNNDDYLVSLADIFLFQLNRPDKALYYYELYLDTHLDDKKIRQRVVDVQTVLANDFLSIVENDGAWMLWKDLAAIAPNRLAIYKEMAEILKEKGKIRELVDILTIIFNASPDNDSDTIALEIARNYSLLHDYEKALAYVGKISDKGRSKQTYLLQAAIERNIGRESKELDAREQALHLDPLDTDLLKVCLVLAGKLGLVEKQIRVFDYVLKNQHKYVSLLELITTHLHYLAVNSMVSEYGVIYEWARKRFPTSPEILTQLAFSWADVLRKTDQKRKAEGILRNLLHEGYFREKILLQLVENSLEEGKIEEAKAWRQGVLGSANQYIYSLNSPISCSFALMEVKWLKSKGYYSAAQALLQNQLGLLKEVKTDTGDRCEKKLLEKEMVKLLLFLERYPETLQQLEKLKPYEQDDPEITMLWFEVLRKIDQPVGPDEIEHHFKTQENKNPSRLLELAQKAIQYREYEVAYIFLEKFLSIFPASVSGTLALTDYLIATGEFSKADKELAKLLDSFPKENYIRQQWIEVQTRLGEYEKTLNILRKSSQSGPGMDEFIALLFAEGDFDKLVLLARVFWGNKDYSRALVVYERLLSPSMAEFMSDQFDEKQIDYLFLTKEDNFWNSLVHLLQSEPKIIAELMQPSFLLDNLDNDAGRIVSKNYERYSWHKLIQNEYLARNATYKRKYFYAEQSYRRLLKEQESTEGLFDLASIYERFGEYRKKAKIYEAIQKSGGSYPELTSSIARTSMDISPQTSIDGLYLEESGRDGYKDMRMTSAGLSLLFTPNLNMDMGFQYENRNYDSIEHDDNISSNVLTGETIIEFGADYELAVRVGVEKLNGISSAKLQYDLVLTGQLDDYLKAYASIKNDPVTDTVMAVEEQLYYQAVGVGFNFDTLIGISIGGDYLNLNIDGDNSQQKYHFSTSYKIFGDSTELVFRYDFNHLSSDEVNSRTLTENVELMEDTLYYWSPGSYTEQFLSVHFKHYFLGFGEQDRLARSYYSLDSGAGSDDNNDLYYTGGFDLFFEMSPRFLLNTNFNVQRSENYDETELSLSISYRW